MHMYEKERSVQHYRMPVFIQNKPLLSQHFMEDRGPKKVQTCEEVNILIYTL